MVDPLSAGMASRRPPGEARGGRSRNLALTSLMVGVGILVLLPVGFGLSGPSTAAPGPTSPMPHPTHAANHHGVRNWSKVEVAFLLETTPYDGTYDPTASDPGFDRCAPSSSTVCEESNAVPFLSARAGQVAAAIVAAHPGSNISFGLADFFASIDSFDDGDGASFHVDVQNFAAAGQFQTAVNQSFRKNVLSGGWTVSDGDLSDNILHSSSITALYGALGTDGFNWSTSAHHVVVLIGSTAPRAPGYPVDYSVSASDYGGTYCGKKCLSPTCEPQYNFSTTVASPACEGWTSSQTTNPHDSIAWLAQNGTLCASSLGSNCTVDTIALYNGVTDPSSKQWRSAVNASTVRRDSTTILNASCDLAAATGGSWDGPSFFTCPNGAAGNLTYVAHGAYNSPNTTNPSLFSALSNISLGAPAHGHPGFDQPGDLLIADQLNNRVIEVNPLNSKVVWSFGSGNSSLCNPGPGAVIAPNDAERLAGGLTLIAGTGTATCPDDRVLVVNEAGRIVWQYGRAGVSGNGTGLLSSPVFALQLPSHDILIVDQGNDRVIRVNLSGSIVWSYGPGTGPGALASPNSAERLANGDLLIADENNHRAIEVTRAGALVWHYGHRLSAVAFASRLPNGDTLLADAGNNRVLEINRSSHLVFSYVTNGSGGSNATPNPSSIVGLQNGNFLVADQYNDRVFELNATLQIVYQYGSTNQPGAGFDELNAPYSAVVVGDFTGLTAPPALFR